MGIVLGFLCIIFFILLSAKGITHRFRLGRIDSFLMKFHKPLSVVLVILCVLHIAFVIPVMVNRSILVNLTGIMAIIAIITLILLCYKIKNKEKRMQWHRMLTIVIAILILGHVITYFMDFADYKQKISSIEIENVNLSEVEDGSYEGEYDAGYIYAKVKVDIKDGRIEAITLLEHRHERGEAAEVIPQNVVELQRIDVDAVSGATNSSEVIKKAIENALRKAK